MSWRFDLASDIGGRTEQQDRSELFAVPGRHGGHLVVLADGMGGQQHGALAAQAVIDTAREALPSLAGGNPRDNLNALCHSAHEAIRAIGRRHGSNPASTCTALYLRRDEAYWVHVGDSRLYHYNGDQQLYRTQDHTLGALLQGRRDQHKARRADNRLYMCLGGHNELAPEFGATAVGNGDWFFLCSDGFWNQVRSDEAAHSVSAGSANGDTADRLVALAARRGGPGSDNVSLVLATRGRAKTRGRWFWR